MDRGRLTTTPRQAGCALALLGILALQGTAEAQQGDLADGEQLYTAQCKLCHGNPKEAPSGNSMHSFPQPVRLAMQGEGVKTDAWPESNGHARAAGNRAAPGADAGGSLLAFAPPFGPPLHGIYGRPAGTVAGYQYSATFLKVLKGVVWDEAALDAWITNSQVRAPGVYMFYKQPDPNIRRKIILYLKAASSQ